MLTGNKGKEGKKRVDRGLKRWTLLTALTELLQERGGTACEWKGP